jgi:hypothetical protein
MLIVWWAYNNTKKIKGRLGGMKRKKDGISKKQSLFGTERQGHGKALKGTFYVMELSLTSPSMIPSL